MGTQKLEAVSLFELLRYLRNFFPGQRWSFQNEQIAGGQIALPGLENGAYYLIEGSRKNNGIHVYGQSGLYSETYTGVVTEACVPDDLLSLWQEICEWQEKNADALQSPYTNESFGGYSYSKATTSTGEPVSWQTAFASRLKIWRKL